MVNSTQLGPLVAGPPSPKGLARTSRDKPDDPVGFKKSLDRAQKDQEKGEPEVAKSDFQQPKVKARAAEPEVKNLGLTKAQGLQKSLQPKTEKNQGQEAMLKFMDSMESEFSVPREEIAEAMTDLSGSELASPPEETAHEVIGKLDLDPQQAARAEAMYLQMVQDWSQKPVVEPQANAALTAAVAAGTGAGMVATQSQKVQNFEPLQKAIPAERMTPRMALNKSIDSMNDKFWMKDTPRSFAPKATPDDIGPLIDKMNEAAADLEGTVATAKAGPTLAMEPVPSFEPVDTEAFDMPTDQPLNISAKPSKVGELPQGQAQPQNNDAMIVAGAAGLTSMAAIDQGSAPKSTYGNLKPKAESLSAPATEESQFSNLFSGVKTPSIPSAPSFQTAGHSAGDSAGDGASEESDTPEVKSELKPDFFSPKGENLGSLKPADPTALNKAFVAGTAGAAVATKGQDDVNLQLIANRAQMIAKHGGGEMKLRLYPEGMGQLDLKVHLSDGKVNLEMVADTPEAKKMIENNLGDLRNHLSNHKLTMDQVKVDVSNSFSSDAGQSQMSGHQDFAREQARQFFNQFREENLAQKQGIFEAPGFKAYTPRKKEVLQPIAPAKAERANSRLDLVA